MASQATFSTAELCAMLCSPDPSIRDETAYSALAERIGDGELDGSLGRLGDQLASMLTHPEIEARTFATLCLALVILRDSIKAELDDATVLRWRDEFAAWWSAETDLRGHDEQLGWLHAIAHGSDTVGALGRSPRLGQTDLTALLELTAARLITPSGYLLGHGENDRMSYALASILARPELSEQDATGWLAPVQQALQALPGSADPFPAWAANTTGTLNSLYVAIHRGVRCYAPPGEPEPEPTIPPHQPAIADRIACVLRDGLPYLG